MNGDIKQQWVAALRSGEYEQGHLRLAEAQDGTTRYCCLGVLCDLAVKAGQVPVPKTQSDGSLLYVGNEDRVLPYDVMEWAGLDDTNPVVFNGQFSQSLASYNDDGYTFNQIASIIEEYL